MISSNLYINLFRGAALHGQRSIQIASFACDKVADPIQKLFLEKLQKYKSESAGGKLRDSNPEIEQQRRNELERVSKQYGGGTGIDMTQFPILKFEDPQIDRINN